MKKYYYNDGKDQHGPFTLDELKEQGIKRETQVWFEGMGDWLPAKEVPEIAGVLPPPIAATPPPIKPVIPPPIKVNPLLPDPVFKPIEPTEPNVNKEIVKIWSRPLLILGVVLTLVFGLWFCNMMSGGGGGYDPCVDNPITNDDFIGAVKLGVDFRAVPLGGVRDVILTVNNEWGLDIDDASIIVSYLRQDGSSDSYEVINTGRIEGYTVKTFSANGANRGVKAVVYFSTATVNDRCFTYTQPDS